MTTTSSTPKPMTRAESIVAIADLKAAFIEHRADVAELCTGIARYILDGGVLTVALSDALEQLGAAAADIGDDLDEEDEGGINSIDTTVPTTENRL